MSKSLDERAGTMEAGVTDDLLLYRETTQQDDFSATSTSSFTLPLGSRPNFLSLYQSSETSLPGFIRFSGSMACLSIPINA